MLKSFKDIQDGTISMIHTRLAQQLPKQKQAIAPNVMHIE